RPPLVRQADQHPQRRAQRPDHPVQQLADRPESRRMFYAAREVKAYRTFHRHSTSSPISAR
ncbi:hypothetical protein, partial [Micromonospora sp. NPDC000018]|uniref:hypothetical protein n=1 Tax=Micromonospora sp. NPDC000018 TaxID=3154239 RepID=UPI00331E3680